MTAKLSSVHPGDVLLEDFMKPLKLSAYKVAKDIGVPPIQVSQIIKRRRAITAKTALLLAKYLGTSPQLWMRLQAQYDLEKAEPALRERLAVVSMLQPNVPA